MSAGAPGRLVEGSGWKDCSLTEVVMPGMAGFGLAGHLALTHPAARVLFLSGHGKSARVKQGLEGSHQAFLLKPFTQDVLVAKIRDVLAPPLMP
jgi:DNA-binding NarL/FixJ family response regulator